MYHLCYIRSGYYDEGSKGLSFVAYRRFVDFIFSDYPDPDIFEDATVIVSQEQVVHVA